MEQNITSWKEELSALLNSLERLTGLCVTFNDVKGFFCDKEGKTFIDRDKMFHNMEFCQRADRKKCQTHECKKVYELAAKKTSPFLWRCWQGPLQIAIPMTWKEQNVGIIFLGPFITEPEENKKSTDRHKLPYYNMSDFSGDAHLLEVIGRGIVEKTISAKIYGKGERWEKIFRLFTSRLTEKIGIKDVAKELNLSPSRASHLVTELFGMPFEKVLLEHRLQRATALLETTDMTLVEISEAIGFCDIYHLSKMFKRKYSIPPGLYRKKNRVES